MEQEHKSPTETEIEPSRPHPGASFLLRYLLPLLILIGAVAITIWLMETGPQAKPRPKTRNATLVEVQPVQVGPQQTLVHAMGTVKPAREVQLMPQVSGEVIELSRQMVPGGVFAKGETLLKIDPTDYRLAVQQLASEVAKVEAERQLEQGRQLVARREYELLGETVSAEEQALMLRQPQLNTLKASLDAARVRLEQTRIDLSRTEITAPFNAVVQSRKVNLGTRVTPSSALVTLIGTDGYWVEVSVPTSQLRWINLPRHEGEKGSLVRIYDEAAWGKNAYRTGHVIRLAATVEQEGRMARLLVEVADPLARKKENAGQPAMLIGAYVRLEITGRSVDSAAALEPGLIREGDKAWVMNGDGRLEIRPVEILFRGRDEVLVQGGIAEGESLIVSDLPAAVEGMQLRLQEVGSQTTGEMQPSVERNGQP